MDLAEKKRKLTFVNKGNFCFALPFQNRGANNIFSKLFGLLIYLCFVGGKFVSVLLLRSKAIFVECDESL